MFLRTALTRVALAGIALVVACACLVASAASQAKPADTPPSTLTVEHKQPGLFAGQSFTVHMDVWGEAAFCSAFENRECQLDILRDGQAIRRLGWPFLQTGVPVRAADNVAHVRMSMGMHDLREAGTYTVRAVFNGRVVAETAPFRIEPWGDPVDGIQVSLATDKAAYIVGEPIGVTMSVRNVGERTVRVPVPNDDRKPLRERWGWSVVVGPASDAGNREIHREQPKPSPPAKASGTIDLPQGQTISGHFSIDSLYYDYDAPQSARFGSRPGSYHLFVAGIGSSPRPISNTVLVVIRSY